MDVSHILDPLNDAQRAAVTAPLGADAGAGRRRQRQDARADASRRLADPGARAPRRTASSPSRSPTRPRPRCARASRRCSACPAARMWVGTFHGIAHRLLRLHWREAGLPQGFQILDSEDQQRLIKKIIRGAWSSTRRAGCRARCSGSSTRRRTRACARSTLKDGGDPDAAAADQALRGVRGRLPRAAAWWISPSCCCAPTSCWRDNAGAAARTTARASARAGRRVPGHQRDPVRLARLLAGPDGRARSWSATTTSPSTAGAARASRTCSSSRATIPGAQLFRLEQNYRSTGNILDAANALIANNTGRLGKNLWTERRRGRADPALRRLQRARRGRLRHAAHPRLDRATAARGATWRCCTAPTRSRARSRKRFLAARIPYRVYGGLRFFERAEIKDALAYLRLIANRDDDPSFERVVNLPTRGIGARTLDVLREHAQRARQLAVARRRAACADGSSAPRRRRALHGFLTLIERLDRDTQGLRAARAGRPRDPATAGLIEHYQQGQAGPRRGAHREPRRTGQRGARLRCRRREPTPRRNCRRSQPSWRTRRWSPARARPRNGKTACR